MVWAIGLSTLKVHNKNKQGSLVTRLIRGAALWSLPILMLAALTLIWFYRTSTYRIFDDALVNTVTSLIATADIDAREKLILSGEPLDPRYQRALSGHYWMIGRLEAQMGALGRIEPLVASRSLAEETFTLTVKDADFIRAHSGADIKSYTAGPNESESLRVVARSVILPGMATSVIILAATDYSPIEQTVFQFTIMALGVILLISGGLVIAIFTQVRFVLAPLFHLQEQIAHVREGLSGAIVGEYPREIEPLAEELNSLIADNKDVVERARTHVSNLAHALKTPIAVMLNEAESVKGKTTKNKAFADVVTRQSLSMQSQVEHHLERARAAARGQVLGARTVVSEIVLPMERTFLKIYRDKDFLINVECPPDIIFRGERRDLEDIIGNLFDNACKWTQDIVRLRVGLQADRASYLFIQVEDNGPGLSEGEYEKALGRGVRLDETTPGTGFGLSIVDDLARAYKGDLTLSRSELGGLKVRLTLPGAAVQTAGG